MFLKSDVACVEAIREDESEVFFLVFPRLNLYELSLLVELMKLRQSPESVYGIKCFIM